MLIHHLLSFAGKLFASNKLSILIYHQVFSEKDAMRPSEPDAKTFSWQMHLINKHFTPLSISAAIKHIAQGTLPANAICVTFDDGYVNNLEVAAPILQQYNIPATVYIATGFSAGENMFNDRVIELVAMQDLSTINLQAIGENAIELKNTEDRINAAHFVLTKVKYLPIGKRKSLITDLYKENGVKERPSKMMTVEQIQKLRQMGVEIGAHTVAHPILKVLDPREQKQQIAQSKQELEHILGEKIQGFAYPNGKSDNDYDQTTRDIVEELEFDYALSTNWGITTKNSDKFQLNRFTPWDTTPLTFHFRLFLNSLKGKR